MNTSQITVHRFQAHLFPVNAYIIETADSVVVVDATLGVSDARLLRAQIDATRKPLAGVIVTHSHPDHYGGVAPLLGDTTVPIYATAGVDRVIRRDDPVKEQILRPMFGDEWPKQRAFPTRTVRDGDQVSIGDVTFRVSDAGPSESPHDSWWLLERGGSTHAFVGDLVYNRMHAYLADGFHEQWLANLQRAKRDIPGDAVLCMGHGQQERGLALLDWQHEYIRRFLEALEKGGAQELSGDALADSVAGRMKEYLPTDDLIFLLRLSVAPVLEQLAR